VRKFGYEKLWISLLDFIICSITRKRRLYDRKWYRKQTEVINDVPLKKKVKTKAPLVNATMISAGFADSSLGSLGLGLVTYRGRIIVVNWR